MLVFKGLYEMDLYGIMLSYLHTVERHETPEKERKKEGKKERKKLLIAEINLLIWYSSAWPVEPDVHQRPISILTQPMANLWTLGEITFLGGKIKFEPFIVRNDWVSNTMRFIDLCQFWHPKQPQVALIAGKLLHV